MKRFGCLAVIVVLLLVVIGYQQWRIQQLEAKIASLATKVGAAKGSKPAARNKDLARALAEAQAYTQKAQEFLDSRNFTQARENLRKAKQRLDSASASSRSIPLSGAPQRSRSLRRPTETSRRQRWS